MRKTLVSVLKILSALCIVAGVALFFLQEKYIFFPQKLDKNFEFRFEKFEEINIKTADGVLLNGLLFTADTSKGLIFYLHGNAGSLSSWGSVAKTYTDLNYDVFILDYRGYGKSEGSIHSEKQLFSDLQAVYDQLKVKYREEEIIVLGYSIGSGLAAMIASTNNPRLLILQAPYYSLVDLMHYTYPVIPAFILKYKLKTNEFIRECKMPVVIFHGNQDEVIYYGSSLKLRELFKPSDTLITLNNQGHNGITDNPQYQSALAALLK